MERTDGRNEKKAVYITYIAVIAALLSGGKFALSFLPNIEIVSLLIMITATVFGIKICLPVTLIFCILETLIYGFGTWVVTYFVYWNLFSVLASLFFYNKHPKSIYSALFAALLSLFFGFLSTLVDVIFAGFGDAPKNKLFELFSIYYVRGIGFFVTHIVSNFLILLFLYKPLCNIVSKYNLLK